MTTKARILSGFTNDKNCNDRIDLPVQVGIRLGMIRSLQPKAEQLTQQVIAKDAEIAQSFLSEVFSGAKRASWKTLSQIASTLHVKIDDVIFEVGFDDCKVDRAQRSAIQSLIRKTIGIDEVD